MSGQTPHRFDITNVSNTLPCIVTTLQVNGLSTFDFVRLTGINVIKGNDVGMSQLNNYKFRVISTGTNTFTLQDPITFEAIDSSGYGLYVTAGSVNKLEQFYYFHASEDDENEGFGTGLAATDENSDEDRDEDQSLEGQDDGDDEGDEDHDINLDDKDRVITNKG